MEAVLRLVSFPVLGGLIGWLTNWLAIRMLFRPRAAVRFLGVSFQGLIPKRRADIAHRLAEAITRDLVSSRDIADLLSGLDWQEEVSHLLERIIEEDLRRSSLSRYPLLGPLASSLSEHIRSILGREITSRLERHRETIAERIGTRMDLRRLILEKVNSFDLDRLEELIVSLVRRELRAIELLGGVLGAAIGSLHLVLEAAW